MHEATLTMILSRATLPEACSSMWQSQSWQASRVHLFCLGEATHLLQHDFSAWPPGERAYCAHMQQKLAAPAPPSASPFVAAGLATLGRLIRDSDLTLTLSHPCWPELVPGWGIKKIAIDLGEEPSMQLEALRLATGLAGCNHHITVHSPHEPIQLRALLPEAGAFFEVLSAMKAEFNQSFPPRKQQQNLLLRL
ncbi:hypothetical protein [Candidatus Magnetaquicoccus inordinatus]|uniref:hypothetical protein n=1 Tax=Candidatus Magnetaquicoccus inordinatus TaxID=2496818 RepID=UPI00102AAE31|nr:hypothetical protein [Candidatus Magnetaquicoccus inordinatus]